MRMTVAFRAGEAVSAAKATHANATVAGGLVFLAAVLGVATPTTAKPAAKRGCVARSTSASGVLASFRDLQNAKEGVEYSVRQRAHHSAAWPTYEKTTLERSTAAIVDNKINGDISHLYKIRSVITTSQTTFVMSVVMAFRISKLSAEDPAQPT